MHTTARMNIKALSAMMIRCRGMNMSPTVRLKLSRSPTRAERLQSLMSLTELGTKGPLFTPVWYESDMYLHPADGDTITIKTSDCFRAIECLELDPDCHITDIPFEDCYEACPAHHDPDALEKPLPETARQH